MSSTRQQKFSQLIKEELSQIFQHQFSSAFAGTLVTITEVSMSPDLGLARVYLSVFPIKAAEKTLDHIQKEKSKVRGALGRKIGKQVRIVPELAFFADDTAEKASQMDQLLGGLKIPESDKDE